MADITEGQTATNPKTGQKVIFKGGQWVANGSAAIGAPVPPQVQTKDEGTLETLSGQAADANEVSRLYNTAAPIVHRLGTGPWRGAMLNAAIPQDGAGIGNAITSTIIGAPLRMIGAITPQNVSDFQRLQGIQSQRVQALQRLQKGVQTEGDAARIKQADISPLKTPDVNDQLIAQNQPALGRIQNRASFYAKWLADHGKLGAVNAAGQGVEQAFQAAQAAPTAPAQAAPTAPAQSGWKVIGVK